jgi:hypothetical protein
MGSAKVLFLHGKPMHVDVLRQQIQKESGADEAPKKNTLVSNLSRYVRYGDTFNRPAPNTFGLINFSRDIEANPPLDWSGAGLPEDDE